MIKVAVLDNTGQLRAFTFNQTEITIGRVEGNDIVLPDSNISKRHTRLMLKGERCMVIDLKSTNGTYVNGKQVTAPQALREGDTIHISDFVLALGDGSDLAARAEAERKASGGLMDRVKSWFGKG